MPDFSRDPFNNVIQQGIKDELRIAIAEKRSRTAMVLLYSGIDAMAYLALQPGSDRASGKDYAAWSEEFVLRGPLQKISGDELYGARCAMLHEYGLISDATKKRGGRMLGMCDFDSQIIRFDAAVAADLMIVSLHHLVAAFLMGVDKFCIKAMACETTAVEFDRRLNLMLSQLPMKETIEPDRFAEYRTVEHAAAELRHHGWA
jgi:hypothetical protein